MCSLFKKKPEEKIVIRFGGKENDLIWAKEILDCDCACEVVADAFWKVVYMKNGRIMEDMSADRFVLNTNAKKAKNQEVFDIKVFYVNVNNTYTIKWGTRQQTRVIDGFFQVPVSIGASGTFKITVENAHKLVAKLCAVRKDLTTEAVQEFFSSEMTMHVMQTLTQEVISGRTNSYNLWANAASVADNMKDSLKDVFSEYGIKVNVFSIGAIVLSQEDIRQFEEILKKKRMLEMKDSSFREEEAKIAADKQASYDTLVKLAEIKADSKPQVVVNVAGSQAKFCQFCGAKIAGEGAFCPSCGKKIN